MFNPFRKSHIMFGALNSSVWDLPSPRNLSIFWKFGSLLGLCLVTQMVTGLFLSMHYSADMMSAFSSISLIVREVNYGWALREIHAWGGSLFFICIYLHMGRGLYYGSYTKKMVWNTGVLMFLLSIMTAFFGYVLPWGQMSFWAATVITKLVVAIPYVGVDIVQWVWGGFSVDKPTLQRFFIFHFLCPFILAFLSVLHLIFLHETGSNKPLGVPSNYKKMSFQKGYSMKDLTFLFPLIFLLGHYSSFSSLVADPDNFMPANPLVTPTHIQPEWYFLFAYAILRSIPKKLGGVMALVVAVLVLFFVPFLHSSEQKSKSFRPLSQLVFWFLVGKFVILTWMGSQPVESPYIVLGQLASLFYFLSFFVFIPGSQLLEKKMCQAY